MWYVSQKLFGSLYLHGFHGTLSLLSKTVPLLDTIFKLGKLQIIPVCDQTIPDNRRPYVVPLFPAAEMFLQNASYPPNLPEKIRKAGLR